MSRNYLNSHQFTVDDARFAESDSRRSREMSISDLAIARDERVSELVEVLEAVEQAIDYGQLEGAYADSLHKRIIAVLGRESA